MRKTPQKERDGGGKGIRTPDLYVANVSLSQLSYTPTGGLDELLYRRAPTAIQRNGCVVGRSSARLPRAAPLILDWIISLKNIAFEFPGSNSRSFSHSFSDSVRRPSLSRFVAFVRYSRILRSRASACSSRSNLVRKRLT